MQTFLPARARYAAAISPLWPAPMTMASKVLLLVMDVPIRYCFDLHRLRWPPTPDSVRPRIESGAGFEPVEGHNNRSVVLPEPVEGHSYRFAISLHGSTGSPRTEFAGRPALA